MGTVEDGDVVLGKILAGAGPGEDDGQTDTLAVTRLI